MTLRRGRLLLLAIFLFLVATRFAHMRIVWVEEAYPAAAAIQMLDSGNALYRDIWFDKPGGTVLLYMLWGARTGIPLRLAGALFIFACCFLIYRFGLALWGREQEGFIAAALLGFYLTFGIPAAVMVLGPDLVSLLPHIACVYLAFKKRPLLSGLVGGLAFWINTKAVFIVLSALLFLDFGLWARFGLGVVMGIAPQIALLALTRSLPDYWDQVWRWGAIYARDTFVPSPLFYGLRQTLNWCGFQAALLIGVLTTIKKNRAFIGWLILSLIPVALGLRFFPRYYFSLLPVCVLLAARAFTVSKWRWFMAATLLVPLIRFGPRYVTLASDLIQGREHQWSDLALADDSARVSTWLTTNAPKGSTLFVWGYRPDIYMRTRMPAATRFLDSQPLSGVLADRHLFDDRVSAPEWAERFRSTQIQADYIVDGLGLLNPKLAIPQSLLGSSYRKVADTGQSVIYWRLPKPKLPPN